MNKVITINLNGIAYQLEESGYDALRDYLDNAARRLGNNPDKDEIIADIEQAIGEKFRAVLGAHKTVVITKEVLAVIAEMGPVEDASADGQAAAGAAGAGQQQSANAGGAAPASEPRAARRLYRIYDGAMISGVCNGLAAYFNIDVTFIRLAFVLLTLTWGTGILIYLLMSFIVPVAETPAEKAAASGAAATAQEFIRRAKAGYYEGFKTFRDKEAHRAWKRKFKQEMRGWKHGFQREMQENARQWQNNWQQHWGQRPPSIMGAVFVAPILSLLLFALLCVLLYSLFSLVAHGNVFGLLLPAGIPLWVGIVALIVIFHFISWPLKAARHDCYRGGPWGCGYYSPGPLAGLVWLGCVVVGIWLLDHYSPQFHEWLQTVPPALHHAADSVREWWAKR